MKSFGQFSEDGREYIITDPLAPPRGQVNFMWNDHIVSCCDQFGSGLSVFNDRTMMYNDPLGRVQIIDNGRRHFYIRDNDSAEYWNSGLLPTRPEGAKYDAAMGLGYSRFEMDYAECLVTSRVIVAPDEPVEIWEFEIANTSDRIRDLWLVPYVEFALSGYETDSSPFSYLRGTFDTENKAVLCFNTSDERPHERYNAFVAADREVSQWCGGRREFLGPYGDHARPQTMQSGQFACKEAWCEMLAASMAIELSVAPGATERVTVLIGSFDTMEEKDRLIAKVMPSAYRENAWTALAEKKNAMIESSHVETPDERINTLTNIWAKQQVQLCTEFGRDGARGFRDTLQDAWACVTFDEPLAKSKIVESLQHQFSDGHTLRGWMPARTRNYSDGPVWAALTVLAYIKETGDESFLNECVPYFDEGTGPVLEHVMTGLRHLSDGTGAHGLVLAHDGDWNDSLDWMGKDGKGESVWTSMGLYQSLTQMIELAEAVLNDSSLADECRERGSRIEAAIQEHGWDGEWYLAGWSDKGNPVGSSANTEGRCYLNTQTWAAMTGLATGERLEKCMNAVDTMLESDHGSLTLTPAYSGRDDDVGRVSMILPGMYENCTPYCHGTSFKIAADLAVGRADEALRSFRKVMPDSEAHPSIISGCEPYAYTNQYLGPDNGRAGESISGWVTGTAGWMLRVIAEYFAGIQPSYKGFHIKPCLPTEWDTITVHRVMRGKAYDVEITRSDDAYSVTVNNEPLDGDFVAYP